MATNAERVRALLGEVVPDGKTDADTMFTDSQIEDLLTQSSNSVDAAVLQGWRIKAANYTELVDTTEGTSKRAMSDLHKHALSMVTAYTPGAAGASVTRVTKIHKLTRS